MADFRKWFSVLAVVALMLGFGLTASAQTVTCIASAGSPPSLRAEGYTELTGDILYNCSTPSVLAPGALTITAQLFANTNITSRLLTSATTGVGTATNVSEALLLVGTTNPAATNPTQIIDVTPATAVLGTNTFRGVRVNDSSLVWAGIPINPPGTNFSLRFTNIRVNATTVSPIGNFPGQISTFLNISGTQSIVVNTPTQIVGAVQAGLNFAVRKCDDSGSPSSSQKGYSQCKQQNKDLTDSTKTVNAQLGLRFQENFNYSFKAGLLAGQDGSAVIGGTTNYGSESGFTNSAALGTETGFASLGYITTSGQGRMGTRLIARFSNVPAGVAIYVATTPCRDKDGAVVKKDGNPVCGTNGISAQLLNGTDSNGAGGGMATALYSNVTCSGTMAVTQVPIDPISGSGFAVWEVLTPDPNKQEAIIVPVAVRTSVDLGANPATPGLGTSSVYGTFGPAYASGADKMSATLPVARFIDKPDAKDLFTVSVCSTTLLFPFVTTAAPFDTGIALTNTSMDPFSRDKNGAFSYDNKNQGACTLSFYQNGAFTGADAKNGFTTPVVAAGSTLAFSMFNGVTLADGTAKSLPNFTGYMIAQCQFLYAHGFAFISDLGATKLAQGYLALVMSDGRVSVAEEALNN